MDTMVPLRRPVIIVILEALNAEILDNIKRGLPITDLANLRDEIETALIKADAEEQKEWWR